MMKKCLLFISLFYLTILSATQPTQELSTTVEIVDKNNSIIPVLSSRSLSDCKLVSEATKGGIFYFEIPNECEKYIDEALEFCYHFPNNDEIKNYSDGKFGGYHQRNHDQIESFYVEKKDWNLVLSLSLQQLASEMEILTKEILISVLINSAIPKEMWSQGTGNLTDGKGQTHFSFNHYRPEKNTVGIKPHRDFGLVSILFVEKDGLEAYHQKEWKKVPPLDGYFVVILGKAFEILVNDVEKVSGAWHQVRQLLEERASFGITCDSDENLPVLRYHEDQGQFEQVHPCYNDYINDCFKETYAP